MGIKRPDQVTTLQTALESLGYYTSLIDGDFGPLTEKAVMLFQKARGLVEDGVVGPLTWAELLRQGGQEPKPDPKPIDVLKGFKGDPDWIHDWEGHRGSPYWPGGHSGVTLDPGVDLGHMGDEAAELLFRLTYSQYLSEEEIEACLDARGYQGTEAQDYLSAGSPTLRRITLSRAEAQEIFPIALDPYWVAVKKRFDLDEGYPGAVHTAFASIGYNRGPWNPNLRVLIEPLKAGDLAKVGNLIMGMQQRHELRGIRRRRRAEGKLILGAL
jgi:GH24 family phage-related lysozyme (muramidase)